MMLRRKKKNRPPPVKFVDRWDCPFSHRPNLLLFTRRCRTWASAVGCPEARKPIDVISRSTTQALM